MGRSAGRSAGLEGAAGAGGDGHRAWPSTGSGAGAAAVGVVGRAWRLVAEGGGLGMAEMRWPVSEGEGRKLS